MDDKTLAKLAILAEKDPTVAEVLTKQAEAISDEELERAAGGSPSSLWKRQKLGNPGILR